VLLAPPPSSWPLRHAELGQTQIEGFGEVDGVLTGQLQFELVTVAQLDHLHNLVFGAVWREQMHAVERVVDLILDLLRRGIRVGGQVIAEVTTDVLQEFCGVIACQAIADQRHGIAEDLLCYGRLHVAEHDGQLRLDLTEVESGRGEPFLEGFHLEPPRQRLRTCAIRLRPTSQSF
jgi:hypothetical protein